MQALGDVKSAGRAIDAEPLGSDSAVVASLCTRLVGMLSHGLKPFAPKAQNTGWASYLPQRKGTPFAMLQVNCPIYSTKARTACTQFASQVVWQHQNALVAWQCWSCHLACWCKSPQMSARSFISTLVPVKLLGVRGTANVKQPRLQV